MRRATRRITVPWYDVVILKLIDDLDLMANAVKIGAYLNGSLQQALEGHLCVGDVRREGTPCAVEFVEEKDNFIFLTLLIRFARRFQPHF